MSLQQAGLEWINKNLNGFVDGINAANDAIQNSGKKATESASSFSAMNGVITGVSTVITTKLLQLGQGAVNFAQQSMGMAASFESASARLKIAGTGAAAAAGVSLETLTEAALKVGDDTRLMGVSADGAAIAMTNLLKAGLPLSDIMGDLNGYMNEGADLGGLLAASINLAAASELDMVSASELAATTMTIFGLRAEDVADSMDYIVRSADASTGSVSGLRDGLRGAGPTLRALGFDVEDAVDALSLLSNAGLEGAEAGTALKSAFSTMASDKKKVVEAFEDVGMSITNLDGSFKSFKEILILTEQAVLNMTEAEKRAFLVTISGHYGQTAMNSLINQGAEGYANYEAALVSAAGIQTQAGIMAKTFGAKLEALEGNIETLRIEIGSQFLPVAIELMDIFTELISNHGPQMIQVSSNIAGGISGLIEIITALPPWVVTSTLEVGALAAALIVGASAVTKLIPIIARLIPVVKGVIGSIQLYTTGTVLAQGATLAWATAFVPVTLALGAVVGAIFAVNKAIELNKDITEQTQTVTDDWTGFLQRQQDVQYSATDIAAAYARKQREINTIYEQGGILAQIFIDKQKIMNADTGALNEVLAEGARSYEDYLQAVTNVNSEVQAAAEYVDGLGRVTYDYNEVVENSVRVMTEAEFALKRNATASNDAGMGVARMGTALGALEDDLSGAVSGVGELTEAELIAQQMADEVAAAHEEMSKRVEEAWKSFSESVKTAVGLALQAYQEGNAEMLAEQQQALGQMLINQTNQMLAMGQITKEQAGAMRLSLTTEYGIVVDETQLTTNQILGMYADWAAGGETTSEDIIFAINNIGVVSEALVETERQATEDANTYWANHATEVERHSGVIVEDVNGMINDMVADLGRGKGGIEGIDGALRNLTATDWSVKVNVDYNAPSEIQLRSPNFAAYYAFQNLVDLVKHNPIEVQVTETDSLIAPSVVGGVSNNVYNTRSTNIEVNANYANTQSEASIYFDTVAALSAVSL